MIEHLGNEKEIVEFTSKMRLELKKHKNEKQSVRNWNFGSVMFLDISEIYKRINKIDELNLQIENKIILDKNDLKTVENMKKEINKQYIPIANYCLFGYLKSKKEKI